MRIGWSKIILFGILFYQCERKHYNENLASAKNIEQWTEVEILSQKFTAEKKWNDTLNCFVVQDDLSIRQRDSILKYYSYYPEILKSKVDSLINENTK
ncbi:MAG: hypothetical protein KatS3mg027_2234 [Bacteroidia bacterium]|nr:MAG: hypothetical protein KatS3mg027_2234 [Bacteroidia bacterium]